MSPGPELAAAVRAAVGDVMDPCSLRNGARMTYEDLGMIDDAEVDDRGRATVRLVLDDPVCVYMVEIISGVRSAALGVPGVEEAVVDILGDVVWTPDRMSADAVARTAAWDAARGRGRTLPLTPADSR